VIEMRLGTLFGAAAASLILALPAAASNSVTFPDTNAEDPAGPDVTGIVVSNDDAGLITFKIDVANVPALVPGTLFDIFVDTDQNPATGTEGSESLIALSANALLLLKYSGTHFSVAPKPPSLTFSYAADGPTIKISASDLGADKAFGFHLKAFTGAGTAAARSDVAPDTGAYSYPVKIAPTLTASGLTKTPSRPVHGKPFTVRLAATESDTGGPIAGGQALCAAKIAGKAVHVRARSIVRGAATCTFAIPVTGKGKLVRGTITAVVQGARLTRSFSAKIT
jgi:hypothetical protein